MKSKTAEELEGEGLEAFQNDQFEQSIGLFEMALEIYRQGGDSIKSGEMASNLAVAYLQLNRADDALKVLAGVPDLFRQHSDQPRLARALGNLAAALEASGNRSDAEEAYKQAAEVFAELGDQENLTHTMTSLSKLQLQSGDPLDALTSMQRGSAGRRSLKEKVLSKLLSLPNRFLRS
jgi:tetratricopeptide (TPR) repeat protein